MSNTGQIKRYDPTMDGDCRFQTHGEFVKYDDHLKLIEAANDRISILEGDVKHMTQECEKAKNRNYDDYSTLRQLDELVNYRHIILTAKD